MASLQEILNRSRQELLDLSTRNRLLSIPKSKSARVVQVYDEISKEVFRLLVVEKKSLSFLPFKKTESPGEQPGLEVNKAPSADQVGLPQPEEDDSLGKSARRHTDLRLQTALTPEGLQRRLLAMHRDARTMIEEQGVNILYLAVGQLKWFEVDRPDTALYAPLILIPVELQRKTASDRFYVRWLEEDIQENLSLAAKLKMVFKIELPEFITDEDFSPTEYFEAVAKTLGDATSKGWEILPNAIALGFFSFAKFLMYRDLDPENWPDENRFLQHPLIAGLLADGFSHAAPPWSDGVNLDTLIPADRLDHVVDADSSQTVAIEMVRQGRNLVIQGPPGTGKSQSITNIIAAAVLDGKKVLFVAEKLAALQVVKRRLERESLGPACLELHSNKANKRAVIEEIGRTWQLGRPTMAQLDAFVAQLEQARGGLNKHVALLHEQFAPSGLSPFKVIGRLVALGERGRVSGNLSFSGAENWVSDDLEERRRLVAELATRVAEIGVPSQHPWRGVARETVLRIDLDPLAARIRSLASRLAELRLIASDLAGVIKKEIPSTFAKIGDQRTFAESATIVLPDQEPWRGIGKGAIAKDSLIPLAAQIRSLMARLAELQQIAPGLAAILQQPVPTTFSEVAKQKFIAESATIDFPSEGAWRGVGLPALLKTDLDPQAARIHLLISRLAELRVPVSDLAGVIHKEIPTTFAEMEEQRTFAESATIVLPDQGPWRGISNGAIAKDSLMPLVAQIRSLMARLVELQQFAPGLAAILQQPAPTTFSEAEKQKAIAESTTIDLSSEGVWRGVGLTALVKNDIDSQSARIRLLISRLADLRETSAVLAAAMAQKLATSLFELETQQAIANASTIDLSARNAWRGVGTTTIMKSDLDSLATRIRPLAGRLSEVQETSRKLAAAIHQRVPRTFSEADEQRVIAGFVVEAPPLDRQAFTCEAWDDRFDALRDAVTNGRRYTATVGTIGSQVTEAVWDEDFTDVRTQLTAHGHSWLRFLKGDYRRALIRLRCVLRAKLPKGHVERLVLVDQLIAGQCARHALHMAETHAKSAFGTVWRQEQTDWSRTERILDWVTRLRELGLGMSFRRMFVLIENQSEVGRLAEALASCLTTTRRDAWQLAHELSVDCTTAFGVANPDAVPLETLAERLQTWVGELESLSEWSKKVAQVSEQLTPRFDSARDGARQLCQDFKLDCREAFGASGLDSVPLDAFAERCQGWLAELESLSKWSQNVARAVGQLAPRFTSACDEAGATVQELRLDCCEAFGVTGFDCVPFGTFAERLQAFVSELESLSEWSKQVALAEEQFAPRFVLARDGVRQLCRDFKLDCRKAFGASDSDMVPLDAFTGRCQEWLAELESLSKWSGNVALAVEQLAPGFTSARDEAGQLCKELRLDCRKSFGVAGVDCVPFGTFAARLQTWGNELESLSGWSTKVAHLAEQLAPCFVAAQDGTKQLCQELSLDCGEAFDVADVDRVPLITFANRCQKWLAEMESLSKWSNYYATMRHARELSLGPLVEQLENGKISPSDLMECFERIYYEQMLRWISQAKPELARFDGIHHEAKVAEFRRLDCERLKLAKHRTMAAHFQGMPSCSAGVGATGIIRAEMERKRGHRSIRRLLKEAGSVVQAIKPVFMMSPLSVAQFLKPGVLEFDLLVIDEASQVQPVDALGAIARCQQIVVVGDSKQLPPTRFFARLTSDSDDEAEMDEEVMPAQAPEMESILGLCAARGLPQTMLGWHYRSRHHTLIAVSNHEFYEDRLFIVPSPCATSPELGLRFHHVPDGVFDRGASGTNCLEAKAICRAVIEHARIDPRSSLGVAAFSVRQQQAILDELEVLRRENPDCEAFFHNHSDEPFFVKNLENVQGDERDVIFISVGYGRDTNGYMAMRFGPLSNEGGERRLNVLISRAKKRCEVFSSITADDIDLARGTGRGVSALKTFLTYAQTGRLDVACPTGDEGQSSFEEAVQRAVESLGYLVHTQVGVAGFFIDLAVVDPECESRYLLGIEGDGASYSSARSTRDRDRLRQAVLEDHGWKIHRIWSTDWFQHPAEQLRKVAEAIEQAKSSQPSVRHQAPHANKDVDPDETIHREIASRFSEDGLQAMAVSYCEAKFPVSKQYAPDELLIEDMSGIVMRIVEGEGPVHEDEVLVRVRDLWGFGRAGGRIQDAVTKAIRRLVRDGQCHRDKGFLSIVGKPVIVRSRENVSSPSLRKPEMLPPAEIQAAILALLDAHHGVTKEEIPVAVARIFGFKATSGVLRGTILNQLTVLCKSGRVELRNGMLKHMIER